MIAPGLEEQNDKFGSRYDLVILAAERARQIQQGAAPLIRTTSSHPLTIALEEISAGAYPPAGKDAAPKHLDEEFIGAALADQDLTDIHSRFETVSAPASLTDMEGGGEDDESEDEE